MYLECIHDFRILPWSTPDKKGWWDKYWQMIALVYPECTETPNYSLANKFIDSIKIKMNIGGDDTEFFGSLFAFWSFEMMTPSIAKYSDVFYKGSRYDEARMNLLTGDIEFYKDSQFKTSTSIHE